MRILYIDVDCMRPDHLGCYGYHRDTSPNIDAVAARGTRCENFYASDAPCLPSRTALFSGRLGIHTGVINHGGLQADMRPQGERRGFSNMSGPCISWMTALRKAGLYTATVSPFPTRHAAWFFLDGFREWMDTGGGGLDRADEVTPTALKWLKDHAREDNWFLHVNYWDPHTPYRTPLEYGNPFADDAPPGWLTQETIDAQRQSYGPHSARDLYEYGPFDTAKWPRVPAEIATLADWKKWIDGYDTGIRYADDDIGRVLNLLADEGVLDETVIIISADHGENQGELNVYGDHQTADHWTCRVPLIVAGPEIQQGHVDSGLHYQLDLAPTVTNLVGGVCGEMWDGESFLPALTGEVTSSETSRQYLVVSQGAWACQRSVRWDRWMLIRTYHDGLKDFPESMLFDLRDDPHEERDLASQKPEIVEQGLSYLNSWYEAMMAVSPDSEDPMWEVIQEGGPFHTRGRLERYAGILEDTGRLEAAERMRGRHAKFAK
ncbi:MAG: sulfatase [Armatimonadetes bacterium]|nr:sulfatase [Armatimonadota bacterium]